MDKSNVESTFLYTDKVGLVEREYVELSKDATAQHDLFVSNNITMANNWIGVSGDSFLFAANTIAAYLRSALAFYDTNSGLLSSYQLTFKNIDDELNSIFSNSVQMG